MLYRTLIISASILFGLAPIGGPFAEAQQPPAERSLRVMSFNIRYNEPKDGVNAWANRKNKVADVIENHRADLVGVQEALLGQLRDLEKLLPDFEWCGVGRTDGKTEGEYSAIFYRKARIKLLKHSTFWLSETPGKAGSMGWDAAFPRVVTWAKFQDTETKKRFFHFNTHFDHEGERARVESSKLLLKQIGEIARTSPVVVTGDFNATESTEVYKTLTASSSAGLRDTRYASASKSFGPTSTFSAFKELIPEMKIDHIFVNNRAEVLSTGAIADRPDGLWPSDHLPVLAEIVFH
jgi:endonuclease/exonuclease/phosphatase family metal-dependent hydrolase